MPWDSLKTLNPIQWDINIASNLYNPYCSKHWLSESSIFQVVLDPFLGNDRVLVSLGPATLWRWFGQRCYEEPEMPLWIASLLMAQKHQTTKLQTIISARSEVKCKSNIWSYLLKLRRICKTIPCIQQKLNEKFHLAECSGNYWVQRLIFTCKKVEKMEHRDFTPKKYTY